MTKSGHSKCKKYSQCLINVMKKMVKNTGERAASQAPFLA
jgi:hypothetical protein